MTTAHPPAHVRDRAIDFLRAISIVVVVVGHWTIGVIHWDGGVIRSTSAIGQTPALWLATWAFQVMPLFFFIGGFSNLVALEAATRRGLPTRVFLGRRLRRLLLPFVPFLVVWTAVETAAHLAGIGAPTAPTVGGLTLLRGVRPPGQTIPFGPTWFLTAYVVVVALSPYTVALHRRFRWKVPAVLAAAVVMVDVIGFAGGHPGFRHLNVGFAFLLPHQLGHFLGDGSARRWPPRRVLAATALGFAGLVVFTNDTAFRLAGDARFRWFPGIGHYPRSLLGTDTEIVSNAYPPTLCFVVGGLALIGVALLVRPTLNRWLDRPLPWRLTMAVNARVMTLFLWHMTAYLIAILLLWPLGLGHQTGPTIRWWIERPLWLVAPAAVLAGIVAVAGRVESWGHHPGRPHDAETSPAAQQDHHHQQRPARAQQGEDGDDDREPGRQRVARLPVDGGGEAHGRGGPPSL